MWYYIFKRGNSLSCATKKGSNENAKVVKQLLKKGVVNVVMATAERHPEVVVRKIGNSKGLTLPKSAIAEVGDKFALTIKRDGTIVLKPIKKPIRIKNVFADIDHSAYSDLSEEIVGTVGLESAE